MKKFLLTALIPLLFSSCEDSGSPDESFEFEDIMTMVMEPGAVKMLDLSSTNGLIDIVGSDTAHYVNFEVTRRVKSYRSTLRASDHIKDLALTFESHAAGRKVTTDHPDTGKAPV